MATTQPKSILKKSAQRPPRPAPPPPNPDAITITPPAQTRTLPTPEEARAIALSHAHALQIRKALELSILTSLEELVDFPTPAPPSATTTTAAGTRIHHDAPALKRHLRFFQPSDYDSLIEERNILSHCGYPLCSAPRKTAKTPSKYVLVDKGKSNMRFVERSKLERFCSDVCARRGLWIRVQLGDEPSWLRGEVLEGVEVGLKGEVMGLDEDGERWAARGGEQAMTLLEEVEGRKADAGAKEGDVRKLVEELKGLGIESKGLLKVDGKEVSIEEKEVATGTAVPPSVDVASGMAALAIEGYNPRRGPEDYLPRNRKPQEDK